MTPTPLNIILWSIFVLSFVAWIAFYSRKFRRPYFHPQLRWWESNKRHKASLPVRIKDLSKSKEHLGELLDISRSGAFIKLGLEENHLLIGDEIHLVFPHQLELNAQVVRRGQDGYGFLFVHNSWENRKHLKLFIHSLKKHPEQFLQE